MIFRFRRKQFSDVVRVVQFLDKESIEYEVLTDIEIGIAGDPVGSPAANISLPAISHDEAPARGDITPIAPDADPAWRPAKHPGDCGGKGVCTHGTHYGMIVE